MTPPIPINLAVEDLLSEVVLRKILQDSHKSFAVGRCFCQGGFGYLKKSIGGFNNAAKAAAFLVLTDLDKAECPPVLLREWLPHSRHPNLLFRVAVREVEAWLLAHREAIAKFLGVRKDAIPAEADNIPDPKRVLISLAKKSKKRQLREAIVPRPGSTAKVGPDYNGQLAFFVEQFWDIAKAAENSPSLRRAVRALVDFDPRFAHKNFR